jgi:hypothetical protein
MQTPLKAFGGTKRDSVPPTSKVEKTASPMQAAALIPTHCSRPALHAVSPRHREAARGTPGRNEDEPRGEGVGERREVIEREARGDGEEEAAAVAVGMMQRPPVKIAPALHAALLEL